MGCYEYNKGDHAAALRHFVAANEIQSEFLEADDEDLISNKNWMLQLLSKMGQWQIAIDAVDLTLADLTSRGPGLVKSSGCLGLLEERARIKLEEGNFEEAEAGARSASRQMMTQDGVSEVHKLDAKRTLARAISFQGEPEQAESLFGQVLSRRNQVWGMDHIDTLKSVLDLAQCLSDQGRYDEASRQFETACAGLERFPDQEKLRAQRARKQWEQSVAISKNCGLVRMKRELQASWWRNKLQIVGSPHATLDQAQSYGGLRALWRPVLLFLVSLATISMLLNVSLHGNGEIPRMGEWMHD
ncbi:uncharacterized protein FTOL_07057 [Fusarium torulosum]|uniref:MalT-like TPR region domain-containing protein n=1 Tax=Fusarium torulosum TaxID=33205 RepID=A0AAE8SJC3_9HYPO|nr:uncharacterized protein FTOL_07057 [Fusarium torulosum]